MTDEPATIRVVLADQTAVMRKILADALESHPGIRVLARARSIADAIEQGQRIAPHVILLSLRTPGAEDLRCIEQIKQQTQAALLLLCPPSQPDSRQALMAMRLGADDFISVGEPAAWACDAAAAAQLTQKVLALAASRRPASVATSVPATTIPRLNLAHFDLITIGSSTGGPPVLERIITALPEGFPLPIVIAQHMPAMFTHSMARRLDELSLVPVRHADRACLLPSVGVRVIVGGQHGRIARLDNELLTLDISPEPLEALYRPSVTELFSSAARTCGPRALAIILTGMGEDGLIGARLLHDAGATIIAQDRASSAVWGMPKAVVEARLADAVLTPDQIGSALQQAFLRANPRLNVRNN